MPSLGDFFKNAPFARPVNPRPVTYTAVCRGKVLPGGTPNPSGNPVAAQLTSAFVFAGGDGTADANLEARRAVRDRFADRKVDFDPTSDDVLDEFAYQLMQRVLREWDPDVRVAGAPQFPNVSSMREMVEPTELGRLFRLYNEYIKSEHPEVFDDATFRDARR